MHASAVEPDEERFVALLLAIDEIERPSKELLVHRLHALLRQRAGVLNLPIGCALQYAARTELLFEGRILRIVYILGLFFGIEVVEIAEEFIEPVLRREKFIFVAEMIFPELSGRVTKRLKQFCDRRIFRAQANICAR